MPRPSTPPVAPSTPLFSFPHPSTPFNAGPFGPAALHPTGRIASRLRRKAVNKPQPRFFPLGPTALHPTLCIAFRPPASQSRKQTSTTVPPFGPAALHPPGRTARTGGPPPPPSGLPAPDACRPPVTPQRLRLFSPCRSPRPFARHLRSLDAASSSPPQGKHPDFRSEARFFAH